MGSRLTQYGFTFEAMEIVRTASLPDGRAVVTVKTPHRELEIYSSKTGRSLRVFERSTGRELS